MAGRLFVNTDHHNVGVTCRVPKRFEDDLADQSSMGDLLLPEKVRLLYIGPMKTGTTSVQNAASKQRRELLDIGVRYPGSRVNHRRQLGALMGFSVNTFDRSQPIRPDLLDVDKSGVPARRNWDELKSEIEADTRRRVLITHEFVSQTDDKTARLIVNELDRERVHVAISLRPPSVILPSLWAQGIKDDGQAEPFKDWIDRIYGRAPERPMPERFMRAYDHGELVTRWARIVGPENVTVIVSDTSRPTLLTDAFEAMLGMPDEMLRIPAPANRSLTAVEAELFRAMNEQLRHEKVSWRTFTNFAWKGAINLGPRRRTPPDDEPKLRLPAWAEERARRDGARFAEQIRSSGVRVVGDLDSLHAPMPTSDQAAVEQIPVSIGASALVGSLLAAERVRKAATVGKPSSQPTPVINQPAKRPSASETYSTRELTRALATRLKYKVTTGRSKPVK